MFVSHCFFPFVQEAEKREQERLERLKKQADKKLDFSGLEETVSAIETVPVIKRLVLQKEPLVEVCFIILH